MRRALAAAVVVLAAAACSSDTESPRVEGPAGAVLVEVARLEAPSAMAARPGTDELWFVERAGRVVTLDGAERLDIGDQVGGLDGERGLLGIAFSATGDRLYLGFTVASGDVHLAAWDVDGDRVDEASQVDLVVAPHQEFPNHNGGNVARAGDGSIWFGVGDGGSADDPQGNAQNPDVPLGKLFRIDPDTDEVTQAALGLRNPWRFSFDREDGSLWLADVGQNEWEEIDHLAFDDIDGANFGWDPFEGTHRHEGRRRIDDMVQPVHEYEHGDRGCSVTGGFRYRGTAVGALAGAYVYGDYCEGRVRALRLDDAGAVVADEDLELPVTSIVSFGEDAGGELYVLSLDGPVYRIEAG
jgi:glucose/arabinose dehydrogenase